jgi:hypothetical protein
MKKIVKLIFALMVAVASFTSCKKSQKTTPVGPLGPNFPYALNSILTPAILDSLENHGLVVNAGLTPATVNGIYSFSPDLCTFDNSSNNSAGSLYDDYDFDFTNQNNANASIDFVYKDVADGATDNGAAIGATLISGSGNLFTVYAQAQDTTQTVVSTTILLVSGEVTTGGIKNMQLGVYEKTKGPDPNGDVVPVGTTRIFKDQDELSITLSTFAVNGKHKPVIDFKPLRAILSTARH